LGLAGHDSFFNYENTPPQGGFPRTIPFMKNTANSITWFITGTSSGFGLSFAQYALNKGYNVVATARNLSKLKELHDSAPDRVLLHALDVTSPEEAVTATNAAIARFGSIDVVFNNAGYGIVGAVEETPESEFRAQMETNFFGAVNVIKAVLPHLRSRKSGAIVNISSMGGQMSFGGFSAYSASKFALEGMSEALAQEVAPFGLKVLIVEPGAFRTNFAAQALKHMPVMEAYRDSVGGTRAFAHSMHGTQAGNPAKAAAAIELALQASPTPLRLQLGTDALTSVRNHAEQLLKDMSAWEKVGTDVGFDQV
jgi:NAD(P)-dependent dehydrogenase (short-subunit alcohol dehydrogenase family)